jgi:hypothetical protein
MSLPQAIGYRAKRSPSENEGRLGLVAPDGRRTVERAKKDEGAALLHPSPVVCRRKFDRQLGATFGWRPGG